MPARRSCCRSQPRASPRPDGASTDLDQWAILAGHRRPAGRSSSFGATGGKPDHLAGRPRGRRRRRGPGRAATRRSHRSARPPPDDPGPDDTPSESPAPLRGRRRRPPARRGRTPAEPAALGAPRAERHAWLGPAATASPAGGADAPVRQRRSCRRAGHDPSRSSTPTLARRVLAGLGLTPEPVLASPSGYLRPDAHRECESRHDRAGQRPDASVTSAGGRPGRRATACVVTPPGPSTGGPGPGPHSRRCAAAADARRGGRAGDRGGSRRAAGRRPAPVVGARPRTPAGFFSGLDVPWLDLARVADVGDDARPSGRRRARSTRPSSSGDFDAADFVRRAGPIEAGATLQRSAPRKHRIGEADCRARPRRGVATGAAPRRARPRAAAAARARGSRRCWAGSPSTARCR